MRFQRVKVGAIVIKPAGIRITLQVKKKKRLARYHYDLTEIAHIDREFFNVLKVAMTEARTAKAKASSRET